MRVLCKRIYVYNGMNVSKIPLHKFMRFSRFFTEIRVGVESRARYRAKTKRVDQNILRGTKEVPLFLLKTKPVFPTFSCIFNVDTRIVNEWEEEGKNKDHVYVGLFFSKHGEEVNSFDLSIFDMDQGTSNKRRNADEVSSVIRRDLQYVKDVKDIYEFGCIGVVKRILQDHPEEETRIKSGDLNLVSLYKDNSGVNEVKRVVIRVLEKIKIKKKKDRKPIGEVEIIPRSKYNAHDKDIKLYQLQIFNQIKEIIKINCEQSQEYNWLLQYYDIKNVNILTYVVGNISIAKGNVLQDLLEESDLIESLKKCVHIMNEDLHIFRMKQELSKEIQQKITKEKNELILKEYFLKLQKKLYPKSEHELQYEKFMNKYNEIKEFLSQEARLVLSFELKKFLFYVEHNTNEYISTYQYLQTSLSIPFHVYKKVQTDLHVCEQVLHFSHYGMYSVKKYIIEFLSLYILKKQMIPRTVLLVGAPGTGKTSISIAIANALNLPYQIIHMNHMHHLNDLVGHRKTYVNSYEGRIIRSLIQAGCMNPVFILDEFDKLAHTNPHLYHSFLNIFDIDHNKSFKDHYIEFGVDLSKVFFICTSNSIEDIPEVLLNRMEIIPVNPYTKEEKLEILKTHVQKKIERETGISPSQIKISDEALCDLITKYTNEHGLRNVTSLLYKIYKRRAYFLLKGVTELIIVDPKNLPHFLSSDILQVGTQLEKRKNHKGTVHALAFTEVGGQMVRIEISGISSSSVGNSKPISSDSLDKQVWPSLGSDEYDVFRNDINLQCLVEQYERTSKDQMYENTDIKNELNYIRMLNNSPMQVVSTPSPFNKTLEKESEINKVISLSSVSVGNYKKAMGTKSHALHMQESNSMIITGNVGKIMQESIMIANTYATSILYSKIPNFEKEYLHIHISDNDIKKDGSSAGINFVTSILSYYLKTEIDPMLTMTGEITLHGEVLRIGSLLEKFIIAKNYGMRTLIIPNGNRYEYNHLPEHLKTNIQVYFVDHYSQIFNFLFNKFGTMII